MKQSIEARNAELMLENIRRDTKEASEQLTAVLREKDQAEKDRDIARAYADATKEEIAAERNRLQTRSMEVDLKEAEHAQGKDDRRREIERLEEQIREANKILQRIQQHIFNANEEYDKKQGEIRDINKEIDEGRKIAEGILALKNDYAKEELRRDAIRLDNNLALENARAELAAIKSDSAAAHHARDMAMEAAAIAEGEREKAVAEKGRIQNDCEVYIRRIEAKYQQAFPGLRMIF